MGRARLRAAWALTLLSGLAAGCASPAVGRAARPTPAAAGQASGSAAREPAPAPEARQTASVALLDQSRAALAGGEYARAAAIVERALSIDPNDASLWLELAEIRSAQGDRGEAQTLARKALTLAGNDRSIAARAARLGVR